MQISDKEMNKKEEIVGTEEHICSNCQKKPAEIFQVTGEFCIECWQAVTHTNI
jgi:hypothetical protein